MHHRHATPHQLEHVRASAALGDVGGGDRVEQFADTTDDLHPPTAAEETEASRLEHPGIRLDCKRVPGQVRLVPLGILPRAAHAVLLIRPQHHAHGAPRPQSKLEYQPRRLPRSKTAAAIVHCPLANVPRVDVAADNDDLLWLLCAGNLRDDVPRNAVGQHTRLHLESHSDRLTAGRHARKHVGVLKRDCGMRDFFHAIGVRHAAGVRRLHRERPNRPNQARHRPGPSRVDRALRADSHRLVILGERHVEEHDFAPGLGGTLLEIVKPADHQHVSRKAFGRRADAATQTEHRQLAVARRDQLNRLVAANPARHRDLLSTNVLEAVHFHLSETPIDGRLKIGRASEAGPKRVAHRGQARKPEYTVRRRLDQPPRFRLIIRRRTASSKPTRRPQAKRQTKEESFQIHR